MGNDIFQSNVNIGSGWKLGGAVLNFGTENANLLATSLDLNYTRQTQNIDPINDSARYVIASDPQGTLRVGAIVGPSKKISTFITTFGNLCSLKANKLIISPSGTQSCPDDGWSAETWECDGCLITGLGMNIQKTNGGNLVIANITLSFMTLELKKGAAKTKSTAKTKSK